MAASRRPTSCARALRDVIGRCIYGIDVNPMAVELCKVSLWMEAIEPGRPLSFLDHRIVCGNGLLGATPAMLAAGVPDDAFKALETDDSKIASQLRARNKRERGHTGQQALALFAADVQNLARPVATAMAAIDAIPDDSMESVSAKQAMFRELSESQQARHARLVADAWCAAFFVEKAAGATQITSETVRQLASDPSHVAPDLIATVDRTARHYRFLHPHLAFPDVFTTDQGTEICQVAGIGWRGGFSLVLGNPPWDTMSPDAKEFFSQYAPEIRFAAKSDQEKLIDELLLDLSIAVGWQDYRRDLFAAANFMKTSGRYRLFAPGNLGKGDFNVYRMFVETALLLAGPNGAAAQITPSGLYNGANAQAIRAELFEHWSLGLVFGLINKGQHWFSGVDATTRFALYSARRGGPTVEFRVAFQVTDEVELAAAAADPQVVQVATVRAQSEQALAISETSGRADSAITAHLYGQWPAFGDPTAGPPTRGYAAEIHMGNDRDLFADQEAGLPVYEGRMIAQYDHRAKAYRSGRGRAAVWERLEFGRLEKAIVPQWRVPQHNVPKKLGDRHLRYRVAFCDVTAARNERSLVAALVPPGVICGDTAPNIRFELGYDWALVPWLAMANSLCVDFLARKRVALHMKWYIVDSLPFARLQLRDERLDRLAPLVMRLTCTGPEMTPFWNEMAEHGWVEPIPDGTVPLNALLDDEARAQARAEIDAVVARHIYGLRRDDFRSIVSTFPTLARNEIRKLGEFRTERLVLDWFDRV